MRQAFTALEVQRGQQEDWHFNAEYSSASARAVQTTEPLLNYRPDLVAHLGPLRAFLTYLLRLRIVDQSRFLFDNASVTVLRESVLSPSMWQLLLLNDTHHLKENDLLA